MFSNDLLNERFSFSNHTSFLIQSTVPPSQVQDKMYAELTANLQEEEQVTLDLLYKYRLCNKR